MCLERKFLLPKINRNVANNNADVDDATAVSTTIVALLADEKCKCRRFGHVHASFWLGIEQCTNHRQNLLADETTLLDLHDT